MPFPARCRLALKEWAVTERALAQGEQVLLLRKGGIHEEGKECRLCCGPFLVPDKNNRPVQKSMIPMRRILSTTSPAGQQEVYTVFYGLYPAEERQKILAEILLRDSVRAGVIVFRQLADGGHIALLRSCREPPQLHILNHPLTQRCHTYRLSGEGCSPPWRRYLRQWRLEAKRKEVLRRSFFYPPEADLVQRIAAANAGLSVLVPMRTPLARRR